MASHVVVVHSTARTARINTTATMFLTEVRDEACRKFNLRPEQFTMKCVCVTHGSRLTRGRHNNKLLLLSQQLRLANLAPGARLELVQASRSPSVISVALQLPPAEDNKRLTQKFASNTSLWEILRYFESCGRAAYNFTQRGVPALDNGASSGAGRLHYDTPVIVVMPSHQEKANLEDLQSTLSQLGFDSGSALLKLGFRNSGIPLEQAMTQISQYFKTEELPEPPKPPTSAPSPSDAPAAASDAPTATTLQPDSPAHAPCTSTEHQPASATDTKAMPSSDAPISPTLSRDIHIFAAPTSSTPQAARQAFDAADYVPTMEHAKAHQATLQAQTRNTRLASDRELADEAEARTAKLAAAADKGGQLRVRMPDQTTIQLAITKADTTHDVYAAVRGVVAFADQPFALRYLGPKGVPVIMQPGPERLLQDVGFSGRDLVTFAWADGASPEARSARPCLKAEWLGRAEALQVEAPARGPEKSVAGKPAQEGQAGGRKTGAGGAQDKESKLKSILGKGLFKR